MTGRIGRTASIVAAILFLLAAGSVSRVHASSQTIVDFNPTWQLNEKWAFDIEIGHRFGSGDSDYSEWALTPNLEYAVNSRLTLTGGVSFSSTDYETGSDDTSEVGPYVGLRYNYQTRGGARYVNYFWIEKRIRTDLDTDVTDISKRLRNRFQVLIPLNTHDLHEDNTWYAITDLELFFDSFTDVRERNRSLQRLRAGIGWRKDRHWTYQFIYGIQRSHDDTESSSAWTEGTMRLRAVYTF